MNRHTLIKTLEQSTWLAVAGALCLTTLPSKLVGAQASQQREQLFAEAAAEFGVPKELLLAISYNQSRWENHQGRPSASGGYGLMHLTAPTETPDRRGDPNRPLRARHTTSPRYTLDEAAALLKAPPETLKHDDRSNIRGAAALLGNYARETHGGTVNDYYHVLTFDRSSPGGGTLTIGTEKYLAISYNHRQGFVKASDVEFLP